MMTFYFLEPFAVNCFVRCSSTFYLPTPVNFDLSIDSYRTIHILALINIKELCIQGISHVKINKLEK